MNAKRFFLGLIALQFMWCALAATNGFTLTNIVVDPTTAPLPQTKEEFAIYLIPIVTAGIVWLIGKIPGLPRPVLPIIAPLFGLGFGWALTKLQLLPWWTPGLTAIAGMAGVGWRELINQNVTKWFKPREFSKTATTPIDAAVVVKSPALESKAIADNKK